MLFRSRGAAAHRWLRGPDGRAGSAGPDGRNRCDRFDGCDRRRGSHGRAGSARSDRPHGPQGCDGSDRSVDHGCDGCLRRDGLDRRGGCEGFDKLQNVVDLPKAGYVEEEFFISGRANVYDWGADSALTVKTANAPYTTRILLRRPANPQRFSGDVVVGNLVLHPVIAPALVIVGYLMLKSVRQIDWDDLTESAPAVITAVSMPFSYSIATGIGLDTTNIVAVAARLLQSDRVVLTPHTASLTALTYRAMCTSTAKNVSAILRGAAPDPQSLYRG